MKTETSDKLKSFPPDVYLEAINPNVLRDYNDGDDDEGRTAEGESIQR